jgi:hypothetical protein
MLVKVDLLVRVPEPENEASVRLPVATVQTEPYLGGSDHHVSDAMQATPAYSIAAAEQMEVSGGRRND